MGSPIQITTPADAAKFYSGFGLAPAPDPGAYMQSPSTQAQVSDLYRGIYPIAQSASSAPSQNYDPSKQQNFYNSTGISQAQVDQIGAPVSAYVDQNGNRLAGSAAAAAVAVAADNGQGIDWNDPLWAAYKQGGDAAAQAELAAEQAAGVTGIPVAPSAPAVLPAKLPIMTAAAATPFAAPAVSHPLPMAAAAPAPTPIASTNGYMYQPNGNGGYAQVGKVNPSLTPSQQYALAAQAAGGVAQGYAPAGSNNSHGYSGFGSNG